MISTDRITDASGRDLGPASPVLERPAGVWHGNYDGAALAVAERRREAVEDPRIRFRGRGEREALAGEVPVRAPFSRSASSSSAPMSTSEVLAELAIGRRI